MCVFLDRASTLCVEARKRDIWDQVGPLQSSKLKVLFSVHKRMVLLATSTIFRSHSGLVFYVVFYVLNIKIHPDSWQGIWEYRGTSAEYGSYRKLTVAIYSRIYMS